VLNIIGLTDVSNKHHDNSAALVQDGKLVYAASEERFTRRKHDESFPENALRGCLDYAALDLDEVDGFAVAWPKASYSFLFSRNVTDLSKFLLPLTTANPFMVGKDVFSRLKRLFARRTENGLIDLGVEPARITYLCHHESHAASAYRLSGFERCIAVSLDAGGPDANGKVLSGAVFVCEDGELRRVEELPAFASLGVFYGAVTVALGFKFGDGEGKTMGLAAYGDPRKCYEEIKAVAPRFIDGQWEGHDHWLDYWSVSNKQFFLSTRMGRYLQGSIERYSMEDVAAAVQRVLEEVVTNYFQYLNEKYQLNDFAVSGGIFLNVKLNKRLLESGFVRKLFIHPHAGDGGTAAGAALELYHRLAGHTTVCKLDSVALGCEFSCAEIEKTLVEFSSEVAYRKVDDIAKYVGQEIAKGKVIGWFQGRAEWGPRALGQRSVVADPRDIKTKDLINQALKNREWFMPFAPSILREKAPEYLSNSVESPFMILAFDVLEGKASDIGAAIHIDHTARPHTVSRETNPLYYSMIEAFYKISGVPVVLNTSFNRHGLPIVNTPKDAIEHLIWGCVHELAIGPFVVERKDKPLEV
jgi:carbamoyltransferase